MKKCMVMMVLALGSGIAAADELSDGIKAWERQDYVQAQQIFNRLAQTGNAEAQRQLGEMAGFGEGMPENLATARSWLTRASAAGNKEAAASLALVERRASHKADIRYYLSAYDGADLALGSYNCVKPEVPEASTNRKEIEAVHARIVSWYECYGRFVKGLQAALPQQTASIMTTAELAEAHARMNGILARLSAEGRAEADAMMMAEDHWVAATGKKVEAEHRIASWMLDYGRMRGERVIHSREYTVAVTHSSTKR